MAPFVPQNCPPGIPDAAVFALQIVIDVSQGVYNEAAAIAIAVTPFAEGAGAVAAVDAVILLAAAIAHDVLAFEAQLASDCAASNLAGQVANIDNTTVASYGLLTSLQGAATQLTTIATTTETDVKDVRAQLTTFQTDITNQLNTDTTTLQTSIGDASQTSSASSKGM